MTQGCKQPGLSWLRTCQPLFPDAHAGFLRHIHALWAMQLADSLVVPVTTQFSKFVNFCLQYGLNALPASPKTLALYVGFLSMEGQVKAEHSPQYLSAVCTVHKHLCFEVPAPDIICNALCTAAVRCQQGSRHDVVKLPLPPRFVVGSLRQAAACNDWFEFRLHVFVCLKFLSGVRGASLLGLLGYMEVGAATLSVCCREDSSAARA